MRDHDEPAPRPRPWRGHLEARVDGITSAVLVFPLLLVYQLGILTGRGQNGVDILTRSLVAVAERDLSNYLAIMAAMLAVYAATLVLLARRGRFHPRAFAPALAESAVYALSMGTLILFVMDQLLGVTPGLSLGGNAGVDVLVISAGAGFHEELIFRVGIMGGCAWLLTGITGPRRAWLGALVISSLVFALAHHLGPSGEPLRWAPLVYRTLAGVFFALVYQIRGFAVAAWTHALYDVYVLSLA
ncbi:MAG: CPBP family intramembrane metalloprotease [Nannocystaceae bacterium]|nr:CPBP family intramembrane metalloprotease [Nannocystaceae bacterium]